MDLPQVLGRVTLRLLGPAILGERAQGGEQKQGSVTSFFLVLRGSTPWCSLSGKKGARPLAGSGDLASGFQFVQCMNGL